ncbi:ABC transporter permease [Vaginisenegalia massiliensis]|uniref:ABC transporter permease n=1 Tax=Vaginisenegalia massiliensis TaxID=2058294 RepID=UPI000F52AB2F|nr:ABC transporter permease [Vaginisenegalia massiliensis]
MKLIKLEASKVNWAKIGLIMGTLFVVIVSLVGVVLHGINKDQGFSQFIETMNLPIGSQTAWPVIAGTMGVLFTTVFGLLFEGYLIGDVMINEFKHKTIYNLFSMPYKRSHILWAKVFLITCISFVFQLGGSLLILTGIKLLSLILGASYQLNVLMLVHLLVQVILLTLIGLLPIITGLIKYSNVIAYVTSLVLAQLFGNSFMLQINQSNFMVYLPLILISCLVLIGLVIMINKQEKVDIL